jgi:hypothetical protein
MLRQRVAQKIENGRGTGVTAVDILTYSVLHHIVWKFRIKFFFIFYIRWLIHSEQTFLCENLEGLRGSPSFLSSVLGERWQEHDGNHLYLVPRL